MADLLDILRAQNALNVPGEEPGKSVTVDPLIPLLDPTAVDTSNLLEVQKALQEGLGDVPTPPPAPAYQPPPPIQEPVYGEFQHTPGTGIPGSITHPPPPESQAVNANLSGIYATDRADESGDVRPSPMDEYATFRNFEDPDMQAAINNAIENNERWEKRGDRFMPFYGGIRNAAALGSLVQSMHRIFDGEGSEDDYDLFARWMLTEHDNSNKTFWEQVYDTVETLPIFAAEFGIAAKVGAGTFGTGGVALIAKKLATSGAKKAFRRQLTAGMKRMMRKGARSKIGARVMPKVGQLSGHSARLATQTLYSPQLWAQSLARDFVDDFEMTETEAGQLALQLTVTDPNWGARLLRAYGDAGIEVLSERGGDILRAGGRALKGSLIKKMGGLESPAVQRAINRGVVKKWREIFPSDSKARKLLALMRKGGIHSPLEEILEEEAGKVLRTGILGDEYSATTLEEFLVMGVSFSVLPAGRQLFGAGEALIKIKRGDRSPEAQAHIDALDAEDAAEEVEAAEQTEDLTEEQQRIEAERRQRVLSEAQEQEQRQVEEARAAAAERDRQRALEEPPPTPPEGEAVSDEQVLAESEGRDEDAAEVAEVEAPEVGDPPSQGPASTIEEIDAELDAISAYTASLPEGEVVPAEVVQREQLLIGRSATLRRGGTLEDVGEEGATPPTPTPAAAADTAALTEAGFTEEQVGQMTPEQRQKHLNEERSTGRIPGKPVVGARKYEDGDKGNSPVYPVRIGNKVVLVTSVKVDGLGTLWYEYERGRVTPQADPIGRGDAGVPWAYTRKDLIEQIQNRDVKPQRPIPAEQFDTKTLELSSQAPPKYQAQAAPAETGRQVTEVEPTVGIKGRRFKKREIRQLRLQFPGAKMRVVDGTIEITTKQGKTIRVIPVKDINADSIPSMRKQAEEEGGGSFRGVHLVLGDGVALDVGEFGLVEANHVIMLATGADVTTIPHESFHAAMTLALTPSEIASIYAKHAPGLGPPGTTDADEAVAEAYGRFMAGNFQNPLMHKIKQFFGRIFDSLFDPTSAEARRLFEALPSRLATGTAASGLETAAAGAAAFQRAKPAKPRKKKPLLKTRSFGLVRDNVRQIAEREGLRLWHPNGAYEPGQVAVFNDGRAYPDVRVFDSQDRIILPFGQDVIDEIWNRTRRSVGAANWDAYVKETLNRQLAKEKRPAFNLKRPLTLEVLRSAMDVGPRSRFWYEEWESGLREVFPDMTQKNRDKLSLLLAATSPQSNVIQNTLRALSIMNAEIRGRPAESGFMSNENITRALQIGIGKDQQPKIGSFLQTEMFLAGRPNIEPPMPVLDVIMAQVFGVPKGVGGFGTGVTYQVFTEFMTRLTHRINQDAVVGTEPWQVWQLQAALWMDNNETGATYAQGFAEAARRIEAAGITLPRATIRGESIPFIPMSILKTHNLQEILETHLEVEAQSRVLTMEAGTVMTEAGQRTAALFDALRNASPTTMRMVKERETLMRRHDRFLIKSMRDLVKDGAFLLPGRQALTRKVNILEYLQFAATGIPVQHTIGLEKMRRRRQFVGTVTGEGMDVHPSGQRAMAASVGHGTWKNNVSPNLRFSMIPMMTTAEREFVLGVLGRAYSQEAVAASHFRVVRPGGALHGGVPTFGVHLQTYLLTRENVQGIADAMTAAGYAGNSMSTKFVANGSMVYVVPDYDSNMLVPDRQQLLDIIEKGMVASGVKTLPKFRAWSMAHTGDYIDQSEYSAKVDDFAQGILNAESTAEWADSLPQRGGVKGIFRSEVGTDASSIAGFHSEIDIGTSGRDSRVVRGLSTAKRRSRFVHYLWATREIGRIVNTQEQQFGDWRKAAITYANSEGSGIVSGSFQAVAARQADRQQVRSEEIDRIVSNVMRPNRTQQQQLRGRHIEGDFQTAKKQSRPSSRVRELTKQYMSENGLKYDSSSEGEFVLVDYERAKRVADEYERMQHRPGDAEVSASYEAFKEEILAQYNFLVDQGVKFVPWAGGLTDRQPYANSREMLDDVAKGHLYYYKTVNPKDPGSFGQTKSEQELSSRNNPMLEDIGKDVKDSDGNVHKQTYNDILRAVHDYFGHGKEGYQFGWHGEYNAWRQHARTFSDEAQSALANETTGQNSWQNFGEHIRRNDGSIPERDDSDFIPLNDPRRPFAEQKVGLMPKWTVSLTGDYPKLERATRREARPRRGPSLSGSFQPAPPLRSTQWDTFFGKSVLVDEQGNPILWFHGTAVPFLLRRRKGMSKALEDVNLPRGSFWGLFGPGLYLTEDPNLAGNYAGVLFDHRPGRAASGRKYAVNPDRIAQAEEVMEAEGISKELFGGPAPQTVPAYVRAERPLNMDDSVTSDSKQAKRWIDVLGKLRDDIKAGRVKIDWPGGKAPTAENIHKAFGNMIRSVRDNPEQIYKRQARLGEKNPLRIFGRQEPELRENHNLDHTTNGDVFRVVFEKGITHDLLVSDMRLGLASDREETQVLHDMTRALWKIMDVDALRHLGGLIVGEGRTHEVVIALDNDQVRNAFDKVAADTEYIQKAEAWATAFAQAVEGSGSMWDFLGPTQVGVDSFAVNAWREVDGDVVDDFTVVFGSQDMKEGVPTGEKSPSVTIRVDDNKNRESRLREATKLLSTGALPHMKRAISGSFQQQLQGAYWIEKGKVGDDVYENEDVRLGGEDGHQAGARRSAEKKVLPSLVRAAKKHGTPAAKITSPKDIDRMYSMVRKIAAKQGVPLKKFLEDNNIDASALSVASQEEIPGVPSLDAYDYAFGEGHIRASESSFEMQGITSSRLRELALGIKAIVKKQNAAGRRLFENLDNKTFTIENRTVGGYAYYEDVPWDVIESGDMNALRYHRRSWAGGSGTIKLSGSFQAARAPPLQGSYWIEQGEVGDDVYKSPSLRPTSGEASHGEAALINASRKVLPSLVRAAKKHGTGSVKSVKSPKNIARMISMVRKIAEKQGVPLKKFLEDNNIDAATFSVASQEEIPGLPPRYAYDWAFREGHIRASGSNFEMEGISSSRLRELARGIRGMREKLSPSRRRLFTDLDRHTFNIENRSPHGYYQSVPWAVIEKGDMMSLRDYRLNFFEGKTLPPNRELTGGFQAARRTEAKSEEELWEELQQRHMEKGDEEEVDLADAIPGLDPEAVAGMRAVDEMRNMQGRPVLKEDAETFARAEKLMEDPEALEKRLTWAYENNQTLNSEETYAARLFLRDRVMEAVRSKDPVAIRKWIRIANTYRDIRAEQARALRIGQDFEKDPSKRHRNMVSETLIRPNTSEKDKLRRIDSKMDGATASEREQLKGEKEEVLKQQAVRIAQIKQRLKDLGLDLDNEDNDWSSIRFTTRALRTISTAHATGSDMLYEWFIASLLWAPITQIRNISGNTAFSFWEHTFQRLAEVAMNKLIPVARLRGESDSDYKKRSREVRAKSAMLQDFKWEGAGLWHSFTKAAMNGLTAFEVEAPTFAAELRGNRGSTKFDYDTSKVAIPGQFGRVVRLPLRFLVGMDEYAKTTNGHIVVYMVAARQATAEGLSDGTYAHTKRTMQLVNNPHSKAWTVAIAEADRLAFQERAGGFGQGLLALRQFTPGARYAFTFVTTPLNIFKVGFKKSPLGVINMLYKGAKHGYANLKWKGKGRSGHFEYTREQLVIDSAEQVLALGALSVIAAFAMPDDDELPLLTGTAPMGPRSSGERDLAYRVAPPMSFRFPGTDTWWSYAGIEPLAVTLSSTIDVINNIVKAKNDSEADKISAGVGRQLSSLMNQVQDKTFMRGMSDLMNMFQQPEKGIARYVSNFAAAWVPNIIRAGLRETGSEVAYQKFAEEDLSGFWGKQTLRTLQNAFPFPFIAPPAKVDMWGNVVKKGGAPLLPSMGTDWIWRMLSPVRKFNTQLGPEQNLNRMMLNWNNQNPSDILAPRAPDMWLTYRKEKVLMTDEEYHDFMIDVGETSLQRATRRQNWNYDKPTLRDKEALLKIIEGARRNARLRLLGKLRRANDPRVEFRR